MWALAINNVDPLEGWHLDVLDVAPRAVEGDSGPAAWVGDSWFVTLSGVAGRMCSVPKPYFPEFCDDVFNVSRNREPGQTITRIAADFGIAESCLRS